MHDFHFQSLFFLVGKEWMRFAVYVYLQKMYPFLLRWISFVPLFHLFPFTNFIFEAFEACVFTCYSIFCSKWTTTRWQDKMSLFVDYVEKLKRKQSTTNICNLHTFVLPVIILPANTVHRILFLWPYFSHFHPLIRIQPHPQLNTDLVFKSHWNQGERKENVVFGHA